MPGMRNSDHDQAGKIAEEVLKAERPTWSEIDLLARAYKDKCREADMATDAWNTVNESLTQRNKTCEELRKRLGICE